jgi:outer membrane protein assembly factor BamB
MKFFPVTLAVVVAAMSFALLSTVAQNIKWNCLSRTGPLSTTSSPVLGSDGTLYVGIGTSLFAIDTVGSNSVSECMEKWRFQTKGVIHTTPILGPDGTLYFVSNDIFIYAIDTLGNQTETALRQKWNFPLYINSPPSSESDMRSSPVPGLDGTLYVGSNDQKIYAIDTVVSNSVSKGTVKWVSDKTGGQIQTTPILGPDGTLFFGDNNNNLHAYETMGMTAGTLKWS